VKLCIGGITTTVCGREAGADFFVPGEYRQFTACGNEDVKVEVRYQKLPLFKKVKKVCAAGDVWSVWRLNNKFVFSFPYQRLVVDEDFKKACLYKQKRAKSNFYPLTYPLDQILTIGLLSRGLGLLVHACGLIWRGKGYLFMGVSGSGKSTLARIFRHKKNKVTILSDDRVIIRKNGPAYYIYGTPWQGEARFSSAACIRLDNIFFIKHGRNNLLTKISRPEASAKGLSCAFFPFWDKEGMQFSLDFLSGLTGNIAAEELSFRPDVSVIDFLGSRQYAAC